MRDSSRPPLPRRGPSRTSVPLSSCAITAGIKGTAVLQGVLSIGPHLPMRTRHEQAATHGGRFRSRYESQAAAQHLRRHRAQNQRRGSVEQQDACATTTASNSFTFISKVSPAGARRPSCSARTRRGGSRRISRSCSKLSRLNRLASSSLLSRRRNPPSNIARCNLGHTRTHGIPLRGLGTT